ncbi:helix-turn-helix domain-containing protein [Baekduia sp. Peel2402]|uniref:helix-turn-helix domain-containing protein n=1 Tax=Baekduia sp. Peel2402 TaxID=3458296 RepID=UPI00403E872D
MGEPVWEFEVDLKALRKQRGMTQEQVALAAGITQSHYSLIERGLISPTMRTVQKLADALEVDFRELLPGL